MIYDKDVEFSIMEKAREISEKAATTSRELRHAAETKRLEGYTALADRLEECAVEIDKLKDRILEASESYKNGIKGVLTLVTAIASESKETLSRISKVAIETMTTRGDKN